VARGTLVRLDEAFAHFFRRVRQGKKPGFPRFKSSARWNSVQWGDTQSWKLTPTGRGTYGRLYVQGVGHLKVTRHRRFPAPAQPAKLVIRHREARVDAVVFWRDVATETLAPVGKAAGVDVGVRVLAAVADSDGQVALIEIPAPLGRARERLAEAQRAVSACAKGSGRERRAQRRVSRLHG
jgi:putative transposase